MGKVVLSPEFDSYIKQRLGDVVPVFARAAVGDFSLDLKIPDSNDALVEFYAGVQMMLEVVREQLNELTTLNQSLEKKVEERTAEILSKKELLKKQTKLYETLLNAQSEMGEGVTITDGKKIIYLNDALTKIYGYSREELLEMDSFFHLVAPELRADLLNKMKLRTAGESESDSGETVVIRKDGARVNIEYSIKPVQTADTKMMIAIIRDVTSRKQVQNFLRLERERAERAELARNVSEMFLTNISHEIRTPMNAIMGFARLLEDETSAPEQKKYIDIIKRSGDNLLVIINDILDLSRLQAGKMHIGKSAFEIPPVISNTIEMVRMRADAKGILLTRQIDPKLDLFVEGDSVRIGQILLNLLSNAVKFTQKGKVEVTAKLLKEEKASVTFLLCVTDSGPGIPEHELPYIFERFVKAGNSMKKNQEGVGIGLAITKQLVELQGGTIQVVSREGEGSIFSVTLTLPKAARDKSRENNSVPSSKVPGSVRVKALVVEDNEVNTELMQLLFRKWDFDLETAADGEIALEKFKKGDFNIVLMDLKMPGMDGYETTRRLRQVKGKEKIPVIAVTAHAIEGEREKCLAAGINEYISKPFLPDELRKKISFCLKQSGISTQESKNKAGSFRPAYQVIDLSYLESITRGNAEQQRKIINLFIQNSPGMIGEMIKLADEKKYAALADLIHKFRSGAVNFYSGAQADFFFLLENHCRAEKQEEILKGIKFLITLNDQALKELQLELNR
jgi:PAS domain S-box-containing protein